MTACPALDAWRVAGVAATPPRHAVWAGATAHGVAVAGGPYIKRHAPRATPPRHATVGIVRPRPAAGRLPSTATRPERATSAATPKPDRHLTSPRSIAWPESAAEGGSAYVARLGAAVFPRDPAPKRYRNATEPLRAGLGAGEDRHDHTDRPERRPTRPEREGKT